MFRSSTNIRELALNLAKVIFMLKLSVKLRRYLLCGCVAACCQDVDGRIILRWIFRKLEGVVGTGWSWLRIGTGGGHLWLR